MQDLNAVLVPELFPRLPVRQDWQAHPGLGRRADAVGEFYFLHRWQPLEPSRPSRMGEACAAEGHM